MKQGVIWGSPSTYKQKKKETVRGYKKGGREKYFGLANIDEEEDVGNPIFRESIKTVDTHSIS